jgi:hypothetical protein
MKRLLFVCIILLLASFCFSQNNLPNPISQEHNAYNHLISDYGPRYVPAGTKYHGGLDFHVEHTGDPAYCIEDGEIQFPDGNGMEQSWAYIRVGNWRYMHISLSVQDDLSNTIWEIIEDEGYYLLVIREWDGRQLNTIEVFSEDGYEPNLYENVVVRHTANAGEMIFRARDYGVAGDRGDHLHLDRGTVAQCNWINPLQYLARADQEVPEIESVEFKQDINNSLINFPSNIIYGKVFIESNIDSRGEYDFNYLKYDIIRKGRTSKIFDWTISGHNHLQINNLTNGTSNIPQHNIRLVACPGTDISLITDDNREGVFPITNYSSGIAGRDIFKYCFNSQQTIENSSNLFNFKYPDGKYDFQVTAQDFGFNAGIFNTNTDNETKIIDNYLPCIKKIEVMNRKGNVIFESDWKIEGDNIVYSEKKDLEEPINIYYDTYIKIWTSEDVKNLKLTSDANVKILNNNPSIGSVWEFTIESNTVWPVSVVNFTISGNDLNNNQIINLPSINNSSIPIENLLRNDNGDFRNLYNSDELFTLFVCNSILKSTDEDCSPPEGNTPIPSADFTYSVGGAENNIVTFTNTSEFGVYYYWDFGDGTTSYDQNPSAHIYPVELNSKAYEVTLSVTNFDGQTTTTTKNVLIGGSENNGGSEPVTISGNYTKTSFSEYVECVFDYNITLANSSYTYTKVLDFGDGSSSPSQLYHKYNKMFSKKVYFPVLTVSVWDGTNFLGDFQYNFPSVTTNALPDMNLSIELEVNSNNPVNSIMPNSEFDLKASVSNGLGKHTFVWAVYPLEMSSGEDLGEPYVKVNYIDGSENIIEGLMFEETGQYLITLNVNDQYGHSGYKEFIAFVVNKAGCADLNMTISNCASQWEVQRNQSVNFKVLYSLVNCTGENSSAGRIEWSMDGPTGNNVSLGCSYINEDESTPVNDSKCITFPSVGKYKITAKVTPYDKYVYPYDGKEYIRLRNENKSISSITKEVKVVDCETVVNYNRDVTATADFIVQEGTINFNNYSTNNIELGNGTNAVLEAYNEITINSEFHALPGSNLTAKIITCPASSCSGCTSSISCARSPYMMYSIPYDAISVSLWEEDCSLGHGTYAYKFSVDDEYGGPYWADLVVQCWEDKECDSPYNDNNHPFCSNGCQHTGSFRGSVPENVVYTNEFYGTFANKVWLYARAGLINAETKYAGSYSSKVKIGCTLSSSSMLIEDTLQTSLIISEIAEYNFVIYPNPAEDIFNIEILGDFDKTLKIEVYNQMGQIILLKTSGINQINTVNIDGWPYGIYFVRLINNEGKVITKKIIKE